jgi:hypothetical protein
MRRLIRRWELFELQHADPNAALDDPGQRAIQPVGFVLEVSQHRFREIEALLALVSAHVEHTSRFEKIT